MASERSKPEGNTNSELDKRDGGPDGFGDAANAEIASRGDLENGRDGLARGQGMTRLERNRLDKTGGMIMMANQ
jgi:hypothetical protein